MPYSYTNPGWNNSNPPAINAVNLNAISNLLAALGAAYDNGGDPAYILGNAGASSWQTAVANLGQRGIVSTSGTLGVLSVTCDTDYILTAASTATLPASPVIGQRLTFKAKTTATSTISANAGQTIGTTSSTSFALYAQEDYVTLEWDGTSIWYVVATNGPIQSSSQTASMTFSVTGSWTAIGVGLSLGTINPGIYDIELDLTIGNVSGVLASVAIGNGLTSISNIPGVNINGLYGPVASPVHCSAKGIVLTSPSIIQGIYYVVIGGQIVQYVANTTIGKITSRRIG